MYEDKGLSELYAMSDVVNLVFRRLARAEEGETVWSILADISDEINNEIGVVWAEMENAKKYGG